MKSKQGYLNLNLVLTLKNISQIKENGCNTKSLVLVSLYLMMIFLTMRTTPKCIISWSNSTNFCTYSCTNWLTLIVHQIQAPISTRMKTMVLILKFLIIIEVILWFMWCLNSSSNFSLIYNEDFNIED